jgi:hypothetical protein
LKYALLLFDVEVQLVATRQYTPGRSSLSSVVTPVGAFQSWGDLVFDAPSPRLGMSRTGQHALQTPPKRKLRAVGNDRLQIEMQPTPGPIILTAPPRHHPGDLPRERAGSVPSQPPATWRREAPCFGRKTRCRPAIRVLSAVLRQGATLPSQAWPGPRQGRVPSHGYCNIPPLAEGRPAKGRLALVKDESQVTVTAVFRRRRKTAQPSVAWPLSHILCHFPNSIVNIPY